MQVHTLQPASPACRQSNRVVHVMLFVQTVHSLDLVAAKPSVIACNMAHTPLATASCNVAVFCLALMGTDYGSFLVEAHRGLKLQGWLWIAEVCVVAER